MSDTLKNLHPCGKCAFYSESVWEPVNKGSVSILNHRFSRRDLAEGQVVFEQGSQNSGVTCVSRGLIALRSLHSDGTSTLIRLAYPGEIIGFRSFLKSSPHQTEARALIPSRVCHVTQSGARQIATANPDVLSRLATRCIDEIDRVHDRIISAATLSNKKRLAKLLMQLMLEHGQQHDGCYQMRLPLSRSDLADLIEVQPETLSRLVGRLEKDGYFSFSGREVRVPYLSLADKPNVKRKRVSI